VRTDEVMQVLLRDYPHGVSFTPTALRLLRLKVSVKDSQIEDLKALMFQQKDGLWFFREMIADDKTQAALQRQATAWLNEYGLFSVEQLFVSFCHNLRHIDTFEDLAAFLKTLGFAVVTWRRGGSYCFQPSISLDNWRVEQARKIVELLEAAGGTKALSEIQELMPHLTVEALEGIRKHFLPEVFSADIGGLLCWRNAKTVHLPEDFAEKLTAVIDSLVALGQKVSVVNVDFALNLTYGVRFREVYGLPDKGAFMRLCAERYQGTNSCFPKTNESHEVTPSDLSSSIKRTRSSNSKFRDLGIPIGAELVFTKDTQVTCTVLNDTNQVEYKGKPWAISALANSLLNSNSANGFSYFSYEGETLWGRRLRLSQEVDPVPGQIENIPLPVARRSGEGDIIGLAGELLCPATWRAFKSSGTDPRVARWVRRIEEGESVEAIAHETSLMVSTVKEYLMNHRRYLLVCEKNGIMPETVVDV